MLCHHTEWCVCVCVCVCHCSHYEYILDSKLANKLLLSSSLRIFLSSKLTKTFLRPKYIIFNVPSAALLANSSFFSGKSCFPFYIFFYSLFQVILVVSVDSLWGSVSLVLWNSFTFSLWDCFLQWTHLKNHSSRKMRLTKIYIGEKLYLAVLYNAIKK